MATTLTAAQELQVTKANAKLDLAEIELTAAKAELTAAKAELTAAKAETSSSPERIAKAELGVAEAKQGVTKAELGVAKAEWESAGKPSVGIYKDQLEGAQKNVDVARNGVELAQQAYRKALGVTSPAQGNAAAGQDEGTKFLSVGEVVRALATIQENQVSIQSQLTFQAASVGALHDSMNKTIAAVEGLFQECNMSQVSEKQHAECFTWNFCGEPPMVSEDDKRVAGLAETLTKFRDVKGFSKSIEKLCRKNAVDPFFTEFAKCTGVAMMVADEVKYCLRVNIGHTSFKGLTDIVLGPKAGCPQLVIEVKPMAGISSLTGKQFSDLTFRTRTQVVLQCAAFQSLYRNSGNLFSCVLTDLLTMYVVQVESYNSNQICANIFRAVTEPNDFVRALLHASDSNKLIPKRADDIRGPIVCFTSERFDSTRPDPSFQGFPTAHSDSGSSGPIASAHGTANHSGLSGNICSKTGNFESLLPLECHQEHGIRANYTHAWKILTERVPLNERCSNVDI